MLDCPESLRVIVEVKGSIPTGGSRPLKSTERHGHFLNSTQRQGPFLNWTGDMGNEGQTTGAFLKFDR